MFGFGRERRRAVQTERQAGGHRVGAGRRPRLGRSRERSVDGGAGARPRRRGHGAAAWGGLRRQAAGLADDVLSQGPVQRGASAGALHGRAFQRWSAPQATWNKKRRFRDEFTA